MNGLSPIDPRDLASKATLDGPAKVGERTSGAKDFGSVLNDFVRESDEMLKLSHQQVEGLGNGAVDDVHQVTLAMAKADLSFRLMLEVRNKLVDAYQEVMRLQV